MPWVSSQPSAFFMVSQFLMPYTVVVVALSVIVLSVIVVSVVAFVVIAVQAAIFLGWPAYSLVCQFKGNWLTACQCLHKAFYSLGRFDTFVYGCHQRHAHPVCSRVFSSHLSRQV